MEIAFYIAAFIAIISTFMVITRKNAVHALLYLIISLLAVSVLFFILGSPFVAALEVIIYAGAIMVLFVFAVMLLNLGKEHELIDAGLLHPAGWAGAGILALILAVELVFILMKGNSPEYQTSSIGPKEVGISLFGTYLLAVELAALMLMAGIIGAYHLAQGRKQFLHRYLKEEQNEFPSV